MTDLNETLSDMQTRILKGTNEYLEKYGADGFKVDNLARYIGISKKTIYNHFPNKRRLLEVMVEMRIQEVETRLDEIIADRGDDFIGKLKRLLSYVFSVISRSQDFLVRDATTLPGDLHDRIERFITKKTVQLTRRLVHEGIATGMLMDDLNEDMVAFFYVNIMEGILNLTVNQEIGMRRDEILAASIRITMEGILSPAGRKRFVEE